MLISNTNIKAGRQEILDGSNEKERTRRVGLKDLKVGVEYDSTRSEGTAKAGGLPRGLIPVLEKSAEAILVEPNHSLMTHHVVSS